MSKLVVWTPYNINQFQGGLHPIPVTTFAFIARVHLCTNKHNLSHNNKLLRKVCFTEWQSESGALYDNLSIGHLLYWNFGHKRRGLRLATRGIQHPRGHRKRVQVSKVVHQENLGQLLRHRHQSWHSDHRVHDRLHSAQSKIGRIQKPGVNELLNEVLSILIFFFFYF